MNYITHLNAFFQLVRNDQRLSPCHISLYLALFQYWNFNRFRNPFHIYRAEMMQQSKIGNKNTYHKCIRDLHAFNYIVYQKSTNSFQPVQISIVPLPVPTSTNTGTIPVPDPVHSIKPNIKTKRPDPPAIEEIKKYFKQNAWAGPEAIKFFNHYKAIGWKIQGITPIEDWQALAQKWMINAQKFCHPERSEGPAQRLKDLRSEGPIKDPSPTMSNDLEEFERLELELTGEILEQAKIQRIQQIAGINNHSLQQLWQAYLTNDPNNHLVKKDKINLIAIAKLIAIKKYLERSPKEINIKNN